MSLPELRVKIAQQIYHAAFDPASNRKVPSPGWCWERTSEEHRQFALRQADFALAAITEAGCTIGGLE